MGGGLTFIEKKEFQALDLAINNVTIYDSEKNVIEPFHKFCDEFCSINEPIRYFYVITYFILLFYVTIQNGFKIQQNLIQNESLLDGHIDLQYPNSKIFGFEINLQVIFLKYCFLQVFNLGLEN